MVTVLDAQKGISPVVASLLLVLVVLALTSSYQVFIGRIATSQAETGERESQQLTQGLAATFKIEGVEGRDVFIRNTGSNSLTQGSVVILMNDEVVNYTMADIQPGTVGRITIKDLWKTEVGNDVLRVQGQAFADSMLIEVVPSAGAVLDLRFEEGSGDVANDASGNGNHGLLNDTNTTNLDGFTPPKWVDGRFGKALRFDGRDDNVHVFDSPSLDVPTHITIAVWINLENVTGLTDQNIILNKESIPYEISIGDRGQRCFQNAASCPYTYRHYFNWHISGIWSVTEAPEAEWGWLVGGGPVPRSEWKHLVLSYNGKAVRAYIDGALVGDYRVNVTDVAIQQNNEPLRIGARNGFSATIGDGNTEPAGNSNFKGVIDEVRVYDRAYAPEELYLMKRA